MNNNIDTDEVAKFAQWSDEWWNKNGPLKTLHDINPVRMAFIEAMVPLHAKRVLDVGCGGGILTEALASRGALVTGLDVESGALAVARAHALHRRLEIDYVDASIETLDAEPFDVIVCMEMLEHVPNPQQIIQNCARLLKKDGYLFLSTINRTLLAYAGVILAGEYILNLLPRQTHDYDKFIKPHELCQWLRDVDFKVLDLKGIAYNPFTRASMLQSSVAMNYLVACQWSPSLL